MSVKRFGVSLEGELLDKLDRLVEKHGFPNRSRAIRYLVNKELVQQDWAEDEVVTGALVLLYDHNKPGIQEKLTRIQHDHHRMILSGQHVHLDHDHCLETITIQGKASRLSQLADNLRTLKGIKHGELIMTTTGLP